MVSALEALERLREGNRRFISAGRIARVPSSPSRPSDLMERQEPFATILGCSDSRVPPEIIFDQGLGDLFVIRVAGNIVTPPQLGSVEFATGQLGAKLVVVLGHSRCGAVLAALKTLERPTEKQSPHLQTIVEEVQTAVEPLLGTELRQNPDALVQEAVRANIQASVHQLRQGSHLLEEQIQKEGLLVVGAEYSLETGVVDFYDDSQPASVK